MRASLFVVVMFAAMGSVFATGADGFPPTASCLSGQGLVTFYVGRQWLLEVTPDNRRQGITRDLQPDLPLVIHY
jgi:hypothetical protein